MRSKALLAAAVVVLVLPAALATPYASGVTDLGAGNYSFVLNQDAQWVTVTRDGDIPVVFGALARGTHTFNLGAGTGYQVNVFNSAPAGWTQYIPDFELTNFWNPAGVAINTNPASANFGKVYVSEANGGTTVAGRVVTSGIYMLNADASDAGWADGGVDWTGQGTLAPWKSTIGPDGNLYVGDYSNDLAFGFNGDMSVATQLIDGTNKTAGQYVECIWVEGTQAGGDRSIYLVDSHYLDARRGLIKYDLGGNATADPNDTGTQWIGPDYFDFYPRDVARDSDGDWYMNQFRSEVNQAPALTKFDGDGTIPLGDDLAEVLWETDMSLYTGAYNLAINEEAGIIAYGSYYDGWVYIFDMATGAFIQGFDAGSRIRELCFDAAGNLVTGDSTTERARFWSPGGDWLAITGSDGTFTLVPEPASLALLALGGLALLRRR